MAVDAEQPDGISETSESSGEVFILCIVYGEDGFRLFARAAELVKRSNGRLYTIVLDPRSEDYDYDRQVEDQIYGRLAKSIGAEISYVREPISHLVHIVRDRAEAVGATQVIIGQRAEGPISRLFGWSLADELLHLVPNADLHIVPFGRSADPEDWDYDPAIPAWLIETDQGVRELVFSEPEHGTFVTGLFARENATDFDHGIFLHESDDEFHELPIHDGRVV